MKVQERTRAHVLLFKVENISFASNTKETVEDN